MPENKPNEIVVEGEYTLRIITDDSGESWFAATEVCKALEIKNVSQAAARLDEDEKCYISDIYPSISGNALLINEAGLYTLTLSSQKPEAKKFKRWVTHEVLPTIRKTGSYSIAPAEPLTPAQALLVMVQQMVTHEQLLADHDQRLSDIEHRQNAIEEGDKYFTILAYATRRGMRLDQDAARVFGMNASRYSRNNGYEISKSSDRRFGYVNAYHTEVLDAVFGSGKPLLGSGE